MEENASILKLLNRIWIFLLVFLNFYEIFEEVQFEGIDIITN